MVKINSKKCRENVRNYIIQNFDPTDYNIAQFPSTFEETAKIIWDIFNKEMRCKNNYRNKYYIFISWCQGLPSILDTCYYYSRSARNDMMSIQEVSEEDNYNHGERECEQLLTELIWEEITKAVGVDKCGHQTVYRT